MKTRHFISWTFGIAVLAASGTASAFNQHGHQSVGAIADTLLQGTPTEAALRELLGGRSLATVSLWADCVKGIRAPDFQFRPDPKYPECDTFLPERARMERFVRANWAQCGPPVGGQHCHEQYHYTDVSNLRHDYDPRYRGTSPVDIVHAIGAAIAVLRGQPAPAPFDIQDQREAITLLAHYLGDIHQPLHAVAIYLNEAGETVDSERQADVRAVGTAGGNAIRLPDGRSLHHEWDAVPDALKPGGAKLAQMTAEARQLPPTPGDIAGWPVQWASETIRSGAAAFEGLVFRPAVVAGERRQWAASLVDEPAYRARADQLKQQALTRAGARLAQLLQAALGAPAGWQRTNPGP